MKTEPTEAGDMLYKFEEMRGWDKNKWNHIHDYITVDNNIKQS